MDSRDIAMATNMLGAAVKLYFQDARDHQRGYSKDGGAAYRDLKGSRHLLRNMVVKLAGYTEHELEEIAGRMLVKLAQ